MPMLRVRLTPPPLTILPRPPPCGGVGWPIGRQVLEGLVDAMDENTYAVAKAVFVGNVRKHAACPAQTSARFGVGHILAPGF